MAAFGLGATLLLLGGWLAIRVEVQRRARRRAAWCAARSPRTWDDIYETDFDPSLENAATEAAWREIADLLQLPWPLLQASDRFDDLKSVVPRVSMLETTIDDVEAHCAERLWPEAPRRRGGIETLGEAVEDLVRAARDTASRSR
jgi:hypothetical protein